MRKWVVPRCGMSCLSAGIVLHNPIALAQDRRSFGRAAQVQKGFDEYAESSLFMAGVHVEKEREREDATSPFSQHWIMRTRLSWSHQPS